MWPQGFGQRECSWVHAAVALCTLAACNAVHGIEDAANGIDPAEKSYIDGPGMLLAAGHYRSVRLDFTESTSAHLVTRRADDDGTSLTLFGANGVAGCTLSPDVYTWFPDLPSAEPYRLLPYIDSNDASRVLHFSNLDCQVEPFSVPNAVLLDRGATRGFLVKAGNSIEVVDPWLGTTRTVVNDVKQVFTVGERVGIWGDAQIVLLDDDFSEVLRTGNNVTSATLAQIASALVFSDDDGLHSCSFSDSLGPVTSDTPPASCVLLTTDACNLRADTRGESSSVIVQKPCASNQLVVIDLDAPNLPLEFAALGDASQAIVGSAYADGNFEHAIFFLSDVDPQTGFGKLWAARQPDVPILIGEHAVFDDASFQAFGSEIAGTAIVDADAALHTGRWVTWNWGGEIRTVAENVLYQRISSQSACANYDGHSCDEVYLGADGTLTLLHTHAPPVNHELIDAELRISLRLDDFDGTTGTLTQDWDSVEEPIASGVAPLEYSTLSEIPLDGFGYLANWDASAGTGTLYVRNERLGSTMSVASGVSDFFGTSYPFPGLVYAVPNGKNPGIWFTRAK